MKSQVALRFIECLNELKNRKLVKSNRQFALSLGYLAQSLSEIVKGRRNVPLSLLEKAIQKYDMSPYYLLLGEGDMFLKGKINNVDQFEVLTVTKDIQGQVMIHLVPGDLQKRYCQDLGDSVFLEELPKVHIPTLDYEPQLYRAFEILDPQMAPSIHQGDLVVAKIIHHTNWTKHLGGKNLYVIVTKSDIVVRRVVNRIMQETCLILHTEDDLDSGHRVEMHEVRQIWQVTELITKNIDSQTGYIKSLEQQISILKQSLQTQKEQHTPSSR